MYLDEIIQSRKVRSFVEGAMALMGWFALGVQLLGSLQHFESLGVSFLESLVRFLGFFTIVTNSLVALSFTLSFFPENRLSRWSSRPQVRASLIVYIIVVGAIYNLLLRQLWHPEGVAKLADCILHQILPLLYPLYYVCYVEKGTLTWKDPLKWMIFPECYFVYTVIRGALIHYYPYPFFDVAHMGYLKVSFNAIGLTGVFLILGYGVVSLDKQLSSSSPQVQRL